MLKWLKSSGCEYNRWSSHAAAMSGHCEVLQWMKGEEMPMDSWIWFLSLSFSHSQTH